MVFAGTRTIGQLGSGALGVSRRALKVVSAGFDADNEADDEKVGDAVPVNAHQRIGAVKQATLKVTRTAGTTVTISAKLQGSRDNSTWEDVLTITYTDGGAASKSSAIHHAMGDLARLGYVFWRAKTPTVGSGNTLTLTYELWGYD